MTKRYLCRAAPFCLALLLISASLLTGCIPVSPGTFSSPVPSRQATVATSADKGAIVGTVHNRIGDLPAGVKAFVARFVWNDAKTVGVFYLDPAKALSVPIEASGAFQVPDLEPGDYVLVIGVTPENAKPIMGDNNQARVIAVQAGQTVDLGTETIDLQQNSQ